MDAYLDILNRNKNLFSEDISSLNKELREIIAGSSFLVVGATIFLLSSKSKYINGQNLIIDDGFVL